MNLIRKNRDEGWEPFDIVSDIQNEMNRVFNRSLTHKDGWARTFEPTVEVHEEPDHYELRADLPGMKKEDFSISAQANTLTLKGERKQEKESKEKGYFYSERFYGSFSRTLEFPTEIQAEKVKASYKDGVLELTLPKSENAKPKLINVEVK